MKVKGKIEFEKVEGGYRVAVILPNNDKEYPFEGYVSPTLEAAENDVIASYNCGSWNLDTENWTIDLDLIEEEDVSLNDFN